MLNNCKEYIDAYKYVDGVMSEIETYNEKLHEKYPFIYLHRDHRSTILDIIINIEVRTFIEDHLNEIKVALDNKYGFDTYHKQEAFYNKVLALSTMKCNLEDILNY